MKTLPDIYFLPEWGKFFESKEEKGEWRVFELKNETGHLFYQFIVRPIPLKAGEITYYDTITPYGFSGPIILECVEGKKEELVQLFDEEFQQYCNENNIITEYVRFNPWLKNIEDFRDLYSLRNNGHTLYIDLTVNDFFMEEFSPKARTQVRRALKNNVEIEYDFDGTNTKEFHRLYEMMANRNNLGEYYRFSEDFLRNSFNSLEGKQFFLHAKHEGRYVSSSFIVHHGDYVHYHLTANDPSYFHLAANSLIVYEACRWSVEKGKKELHLGGGTIESLDQFKKKFTKTAPLDLLMGKKVRNEETYNLLVEYKKNNGGIENPGYFPLYRG